MHFHRNVPAQTCACMLLKDVTGYVGVVNVKAKLATPSARGDADADLDRFLVENHNHIAAKLAAARAALRSEPGGYFTNRWTTGRHRDLARVARRAAHGRPVAQAR